MRSGLPELHKSDSVRLCLIVWDGIGSLGQGSRSGCRNSPMRHTSKPLSSFLLNLHFPVRPDGAYHQWRKVPSRELSIDLTLFHPATGQVRLQSAARGTNAVLHPWLRERLSAILAELPPPAPSQDPAATPAAWAVWQAGLTMPFTLPHDLPPLQ